MDIKQLINDKIIPNISTISSILSILGAIVYGAIFFESSVSDINTRIRLLQSDFNDIREDLAEARKYSDEGDDKQEKMMLDFHESCHQDIDKINDRIESIYKTFVLMKAKI